MGLYRADIKNGKRGYFMKAYVDPDLCIGCGLCAGSCPEVFAMNEDGQAEAIEEVSAEQKACAIDARDNCPVSAISVKE